MRFVLIAVLASGASARADTGVYVSQSLSVISYEGDLSAYGGSGGKLEMNLGIRRGAWTTEILGGCVLELVVDGDARDGGPLCWTGMDLKLSSPLAGTRWGGLGVKFTVQAGPRYFGGGNALNGYGGPGLSASARLEADGFVIGYYLTAGVDTLWMTMPADGLVGYMPFFGLGAKLGWM